jgi:hypothetical protein
LAILVFLLLFNTRCVAIPYPANIQFKVFYAPGFFTVWIYTMGSSVLTIYSGNTGSHIRRESRRDCHQKINHLKREKRNLFFEPLPEPDEPREPNKGRMPEKIVTYFTQLIYTMDQEYHYRKNSKEKEAIRYPVQTNAKRIKTGYDRYFHEVLAWKKPFLSTLGR